jgi:hypothetical protein
MKRIFLLLLSLALVSTMQAQTAKDSVVAVINSFFEGMRKADTMQLKMALSERVDFRTIIPDAKGNASKVMEEKVEEFVSSIPKYPIGSLDERIEFETIKIDQQLALVWTPYQFYFNKKFSHCGVNCFQLVRFSTGWKIQSIIDTRRKSNCQ